MAIIMHRQPDAAAPGVEFEALDSDRRVWLVLQMEPKDWERAGKPDKIAVRWEPVE